MRELKVGKMYRHFKGDVYLVLGTGIHSETKEEYVTRILKNYKKYKTRIKVIEKGLYTDDDNILSAMNYDSVRVQTSNLSNLDNNILSREEEKERLIKYVNTVDTILESLNSKDLGIIRDINFERLKFIDIAYKNNCNDKSTVFYNNVRIIKELVKLI